MSRELVHLKKYRRVLLDRYRSQTEQLRLKIEKFDRHSLKIPLGEGEWTPHQVLAHVMATEKHAFTPRIRGIQDETNPAFENFNELDWMLNRYRSEKTIDSILSEIEQARIEAHSTLDAEDSVLWNRTGQHALRGVRTLQWWVEYAVAHVEDHLRQLDGA